MARTRTTLEVQSCAAQMLSRSVTCSVLQRNAASIINIGFNYVFVSVCKVNLSAQLLYVVMVKKYSLKVGGTQLQKRSRSGTQKQKVGNPCHSY